LPEWDPPTPQAATPPVDKIIKIKELLGEIAGTKEEAVKLRGRMRDTFAIKKTERNTIDYDSITDGKADEIIRWLTTIFDAKNNQSERDGEIGL
jgi:hypothetical protein